jgi:glycosyltransferase involved in cell wall biosynthesis
MIVLLLSDFSLDHSPGGAQRSNQIIVNEGISRGHHIKCFHYDSEIKILEEKYDLVISSNLEVMSNTYPRLVESIPNLNNHVRLEHDSNLYWSNDFREKFWGSCKLSFFLTKFHHKFFVDMYGDIFPNVRIVPDPIDESFRDMELHRTDEIGYVGFMHNLKGTDNFIDYVDQNKDKRFVVAGWGSGAYVNKIKDRENIEFLGKIEHDQMLEFYNRIGALYYNPVCNEPFCRAVGEALMCGTQIVGGSDRIGSLHMFNEDSGFRDKCINAASDFWDILEC